MRKGTVINLGQFKDAIAFLRKNWCILLLTFAFIIGLVFGSFLTKHNATVLKWAENYTRNYLELRVNAGFGKIFLNSFMLSFGFLLVNSVLGTSVIGVSTVPIIIGFRGAVLGSLMTNVYGEYALKGIVINALAIVPTSVISVLFMIISAREAMRLSACVIKITLPNSPPRNLSPAFSAFLKRTCVLLIPIILSAVIDAWGSAKAISFFDF